MMLVEFDWPGLPKVVALDLEDCHLDFHSVGYPNALLMPLKLQSPK